jgi:ElaB/YqjD/DUF883 family membrane-anchored ribosome-binding protein
MEKDIINSLNEGLEDAIDEGRQMLERSEINERILDFKTETELYIRKHPFQSVIAGAVAGYILGKIFRS